MPEGRVSRAATIATLRGARTGPGEAGGAPGKPDRLRRAPAPSASRGRARPPRPDPCASLHGRRVGACRHGCVASSPRALRRARAGCVRRLSSGGQSPPASSGRCVTPAVGSWRIAPRCSATPARRGWSRPVAFTSKASGAAGSPRTASSKSGPSRSASSPGSYGAPAVPTATAVSRPSAAPAQPGSPAWPGPVPPRPKQTKQPAGATRPLGRNGGGEAPANACCSRISSSRSAGQRPIP